MSRKPRTRKTNRSTLSTGDGQSFLNRLDPAHIAMDMFAQPLTQEVWSDKYRWDTETHPDQTFARVANAIYANDPNGQELARACNVMCAGLWMPGGRIIAGAGTTKQVTLMNCYVNKRLEDSLDDIMAGVSIAAITQQQGGGIGTDFSTLRPRGAVLHRTGAIASGPLPFMDMWHSMCQTIKSAGDRRGAMMTTLCDTHPDLPVFIVAKQEKGRLTNTNVSVLVSDAFMEAIKEDEDWLLYFHVPPKHRDLALEEHDFYDENGVQQYVYSVHKARSLWELITKNTYEWSEPGVIFIDRINDMNNLKYCEQISCTNPCGEQPLPPHGTCNLGAINLARLVRNPFSPTPQFDWDLLRDITKVGVRFLDNVIDVTNYPLPEQQAEEFGKRRLGLGVSGLADALAQLNIRYGSRASLELTDKIMYTICQQAYMTSTELAEERGCFPLYSQEIIADNFLGQQVDFAILEKIRKVGLRNGVLLTVAPTGTTSILFGNISSGIEPNFAHGFDRKVLQADNTFKTYQAKSYCSALYEQVTNKKVTDADAPGYLDTAGRLTIEDHITIQAAVQRWVDASVSKTINLPKETPYETFKNVYTLAYSLGCKGCTTYRPSDVRGSILSSPNEHSIQTVRPSLATRSEILSGITHKVKWPSMSSALYITINRNEEGTPFEVFFNSKDARYQEWMTALSLMVSAILRKGDNDVGFIANELEAVHSIHDTAWIKPTGEERGRFFGSLIAYIGYVLGKDFKALPPSQSPAVLLESPVGASANVELCPSCHAPALLRKEGCKVCMNCNFTTC